MGETVFPVEKIVVRRGQQEVIHEFSFCFEKGSPFCIVGESGSGKTSLLMALLRLIPMERGNVLVTGRALPHSRKDLAQCCGIVFQDYQLFPHLNVKENILVAPYLRGDSGSIEAPLIHRLGLTGFEERYPHELSEGQKQRVAIAKSLVLRPGLLFLDEPSSALDVRTSESLADLLLELNEETQIICVSHDIPFFKRFCQRGIRFDSGRIDSEGSLEMILAAKHAGDSV